MLFSIIVTVYKVEEYLRECIESILSQNFSDFELILVDDSSPDGCPAICDEYAAADSRVSVIHRPNGGPDRARKSGLMAAGGEYVIYVDGDDRLAPGALLHFGEKIRISGADVILTAKLYDYGDRSKKVTECIEDGYYSGDMLKEKIYPLAVMNTEWEHLQYQMIGHAMRRSVLYPCQMRIAEGLKFGEDLLCLTEVFYSMSSIYVSSEVTYFYRIRESSLSRGIGDGIFEQFKNLLREMRLTASEHGEGFSEKIDRYTAFTCFIFMERTAAAKDSGELKRVAAHMDSPVIREGLKNARFTRLKFKKKAVLRLIKKKRYRAAYVFLRAYEALKAPVAALKGR